MTGKPAAAHWICPPPAVPTAPERASAAALFDDIAGWNHAPFQPARFAGLELEVALTLLADGPIASPPDNDFWPDKCRSLLMRPAIEPIAYAAWNRLAAFDLDDAYALRLASILAGYKLVIRDKKTIGESRAGNVEFEPVDRAMTWLADLAAAAARPELAPVLPAYAFARVIMAHPFSDANGRFARLMVHAALARTAGLARPSLALAPAFYRHAGRLAAALHNVSEHADWSHFHDAFFAVLRDALGTVRTYLR